MAHLAGPHPAPGIGKMVPGFFFSPENPVMQGAAMRRAPIGEKLPWQWGPQFQHSALGNCLAQVKGLTGKSGLMGCSCQGSDTIKTTSGGEEVVALINGRPVVESELAAGNAQPEPHGGVVGIMILSLLIVGGLALAKGGGRR